MPIFLSTLAIRQKSQTIRFKTAAEMLETFGMHKGGREYRRLVAVFEANLRGHDILRSDSLTAKAKVVQRSRFDFLREAQIWYDRHPDQHALGKDFENATRSDGFYQEIMAHPIPTDLAAVKVLASAPASTWSCGWVSAGSSRRGRRRSRSSVHPDWFTRSVLSNTSAKGVSYRNWNNG